MVEQEYLPTGEEDVKASPHSYCTLGMGRVCPVYCDSSKILEIHSAYFARDRHVCTSVLAKPSVVKEYYSGNYGRLKLD